MEDHEYELALKPDSDDLHFGSDSGESALPSPRITDESLAIGQDWQVEVEETVEDKEE